jgi:hypothetical protein
LTRSANTRLLVEVHQLASSGSYLAPPRAPRLGPDKTLASQCPFFFQSDPFQLILSSSRYCSRIIVTNLYPTTTVNSTLRRLTLTASRSHREIICPPVMTCSSSLDSRTLSASGSPRSVLFMMQGIDNTENNRATNWNQKCETQLMSRL